MLLARPGLAAGLDLELVDQELPEGRAIAALAGHCVRAGPVSQALLIDAFAGTPHAGLLERARASMLDFEADEIGLVIYSSSAASAGTEPALADNDQQDVTLNNCFRDVDAKVLAERNIVDIHEDRFIAITAGEAISTMAGHRPQRRTDLPPIAIASA